MEIYSVHNIIQRISSLYNKGAESDESRLTPRHIYSVVLSNRATLLEQQAKKKQKINQINYQTLQLELELVENIKVNCSDVDLDCPYFKSKIPLPKVLSDMNKMLIQSVQTIDNSILFMQTDTNKLRYKNKGNRYAKTTNNYFIENGYIYIPYKCDIPNFIKITALFDDPVQVERLMNTCDDSDTICKSNFEFDFKVDTSLLTTIIQLSAEELIEWFTRMREDVTNNSRDSIIEETK